MLFRSYQDIVSKDTDIPVVGSFTISGDVDADDLAEYEDAEIIVTAYAVQADGFTTAEAAWTAADFE